MTFLIIPETHSIEMSWETLPVDYGIEIARNYLASEQAPRAYPTPLTPCSSIRFATLTVSQNAHRAGTVERNLAFLQPVHYQT